MAYQDDFRNKVLAALKAKNLAVDISQEATQKAIVEDFYRTNLLSKASLTLLNCSRAIRLKECNF